MRATQLGAGFLGALLLLARPARAGDLPFPAPLNRDEMRAAFETDAGAEAMLRRNGFVVLDGAQRSGLHEVYPRERKDGLPLFVSESCSITALPRVEIPRVAPQH